MNKLLTIVIPTYNMQKFLPRCLDSLMVSENRMELMEVLVINDGSKDDSSAIAHSYAERFPSTFRVIDKENGNYGSCVNRGLREAKGKYFRILDADDKFDKHSLDVFINRLKDLEVDAVFTRCIHCDTSDKIISDKPIPENIPVDSVIDATQFDAVSMGYWPFIMHMVTYKTSVLRSVKLTLSEGISYSDNEFVFYPLEKVSTMTFIDIPLYWYTIGREGQTMTPNLMKKRVKHFEIILDKMLNYLEANRNSINTSIYTNQLGIAFSMMHWMYSLLLSSDLDDESTKLIDKLEAYANNVPGLYQCTNEIDKYGFKYVEYWRRTKRTLSNPIVRVILQWNRVKRKLIRR